MQNQKKHNLKTRANLIREKIRSVHQYQMNSPIKGGQEEKVEQIKERKRGNIWKTR